MNMMSIAFGIPYEQPPPSFTHRTCVGCASSLKIVLLIYTIMKVVSMPNFNTDAKVYPIVRLQQHCQDGLGNDQDFSQRTNERAYQNSKREATGISCSSST